MVKRKQASSVVLLLILIIFVSLVACVVSFVVSSTMVARSFMNEKNAKTQSLIGEWKTYSSPAGYSIQYPGHWYVYKYNDAHNSVAFSDVLNPSDIPMQIDPEGHSIIIVSFSQEAMPMFFPYTNGSEKNDTITPYSINGYVGIRGKQESVLGLGEAVYLKHPRNGYIVLDFQIGDFATFDQMLATISME